MPHRFNIFLLRAVAPLRSLDIWCAAIILAAITTAFFLSTNRFGSTAVYVGDANYYYAYLPSIVFDHDLDLTNQYKVTGNWYGFGHTVKDVPSNVFGVGPAVFALPFFLFGMLLSKLAGIAPTGFGIHETTTTLYASAFFTALSAWPAALLIRRHYGGRIVPWLIAAFGVVGTSVAYYAIRQPGYAHPFATFWIAAFVNHWDKGLAQPTDPAKRWRWWLVSGALLGAATLARPQCVSWGIILLWPAWRDLRAGIAWSRQVLHAGIALVVATLVFSPQLYVWKVLYGHWLAVPQGKEFMRWDSPALAPVLFASRNGLFAFTPMVALCVLGIFLVRRKQAAIAAALGLGFALQVVTNGAVWDWWAGGSFGGRRFDSCYIVFCFGLAGFLYFPQRLTNAIGELAKRVRGEFPQPPMRWLGMLGSAALVAWIVMLVGGNIALTGRISPPNLVSGGGNALYLELQRLVPPPWTSTVASLSRWATQPARWWFAKKYNCVPEAYDWVVGTHFLGELFPGLNGYPPAREQTVTLHPSQPFLVGLVPGQHPVRAEDKSLRLLLPINRKHGPMVVRVDFDRPLAVKDARMSWNGDLMVTEPVGNSLQFIAPTLRRGTNVLDVRTEPGVGFLSFTLWVPPNGLP